MKKAVILIAVLVVAGVAAFFVLRGRGNGVQYKTEQVSRGDVIETVTASGQLNAITTVNVGTQVSGRIKNIYVDFNSPVKKGQVIAEVDPEIYQSQVDQARGNLAMARANLEKAEAALVDAKRNYDRSSELFAKDLIAKSDRDTAETNYQSAKAAVGAAKAQITQLQAALDYAETNLKYTKIISPVEGVVISRSIDVGQTVVASFQAPTLFTIAQDLTKMQIDTNVNEADIGGIQVGQNVSFTVDAYPELTFKGKVWQVRNAPIIVSNVVTYDVVITVDNPELKLKPGMTANASIIIAEKKDVLRAPNAALRFVPQEKSSANNRVSKPAKPVYKGPGVWVVQNGQPVRVSVTTGISDDSYTEILSGGIKEGQEVIVGAQTKEKTQTTRPPGMF